MGRYAIYLLRMDDLLGVGEMNERKFKATDVRHFGYYIPKSDGTYDFFVHKQLISPDVLTEFHNICSVVFDLQPIIFAFDVVERNYQELISSTNDHRMQLNNSATVNIRLNLVAIDGFILTAQKITNFLSSASAFLTQTEIQLKKVHGKDSHEFGLWDTRRKELHAGNFSYRFLYELRNFSQHRNLPLSSFNLAGERSSEDAPMLFKTNGRIFRDGLFESGHDWKKSLVDELRKQPPEFELLPFIDEYLSILREICLEAVTLQSSRLAECARYFDVVQKKLQTPIGAVPVIFVGESSSEQTPPSRIEIIPVGQLEFALREYDKLINAKTSAR